MSSKFQLNPPYLPLDVCSETDLKNAEVFKGVTFCSSCSQRIFQGCSTARETKVARPKKSKSRRKARRERPDREKTAGVIELAGMGASTGSESKSLDEAKKRSNGKTIALSTKRSSKGDKEVCYKEKHELKKDSVEMGTITNVTQVLLSQIEYIELRQSSATDRQLQHKKDHKRATCSDLRIAELGASTEIANMALRKKSELPVIIKSESRLQREESISLSMLKQESDISGDANEEWIGDDYSTQRNAAVRPLMERRIGSLLKLPYKSFKKNILNRSSLISVLMTSSGSKEESTCIMTKVRRLFKEEINDHQRRGIRKLHTTINRRKTPYKLGWLNLMMKMSRIIESNETKNEQKRCKHFRRSHSYRCMRSKVMRLAGPTKSELAAFRSKIKNAVAPNFLRNVITYNKKYALMMSKSCGSDAHEVGKKTFENHS